MGCSQNFFFAFCSNAFAKEKHFIYSAGVSVCRELIDGMQMFLSLPAALLQCVQCGVGICGNPIQIFLSCSQNTGIKLLI